MDSKPNVTETLVNKTPSQTLTESYTNIWIIILLILFFQPAAWYFIYKEKHYNIWFAYLLWVNAPILVIFAVLVSVAIPNLLKLYENMNIKSIDFINTLILFGAIIPGIMIIIALIEIIFGVVIWRKYHKLAGLSKGLKWLAIVILSINLFFSPYPLAYNIFDIISQIYNLTSENAYTPHLRSIPIPTHTVVKNTSLTINPSIQPSSIPIINKTTEWKTYTSTDNLFSFVYPSEVNISTVSNFLPIPFHDNELYVREQNMDSLTDGTMNYDKDTAIADQKSLQSGDFGEKALDFAVSASQKVINVGGINAKTFMVLGRFVVGDITLERIVILYKNNKQIILNLKGPTRVFISDSPQYFSYSNRVSSWINTDAFYRALESHKGPPAAQKWYDDFDQILSTFEFLK